MPCKCRAGGHALGSSRNVTPELQCEGRAMEHVAQPRLLWVKQGSQVSPRAVMRVGVHWLSPPFRWVHSAQRRHQGWPGASFLWGSPIVA